MDIERMKRLLSSGIEAGKKVKAVREEIKTYTTQKQDMYDDTTEILKPSIDVQKKVKKTIDEKQDEVIKQLQENQKAFAEELAPIKEVNQRALIFEDELPKAIKLFDEPKAIEGSDEESDEGSDKLKINKIILDIEKNFTEDDKNTLKLLNLTEPKDLMKKTKDEIIKEKLKSAKISKSIGTEKRWNKVDKNVADKQLKTLNKYREMIQDFLSSLKYIGEGIRRYNQPKRNAYKISQKGQYGGLVIDLPKLYGHLKVVAHKNGQEVYNKQADFDTLDLLTKRFNNRKNYSELARSVFHDLNRLSQIPIHRTSKKYSKLGSGVVYYNNPQDLLSRLEILGGSMSAGNDSSDVREEFVKIAHRLNKLNVINNKQMNDLIKEYII